MPLAHRQRLDQELGVLTKLDHASVGHAQQHAGIAGCDRLVVGTQLHAGFGGAALAIALDPGGQLDRFDHGAVGRGVGRGLVGPKPGAQQQHAQGVTDERPR